jgi:hypothetical protein
VLQRPVEPAGIIGMWLLGSSYRNWLRESR